MTDEERERREYFERIDGVGEWDGMSWKTSSYARGNIPAWAPAMIRRHRGSETRSMGRDASVAALFLVWVIGLPAVLAVSPPRFRAVAAIAYVVALGAVTALGILFLRRG